MTITPGNYSDYIIYIGGTFEEEVSWAGQSGLINLTGFTAKMHIRSELADAAPIMTLTTENGRLALGGANGTVTINISATDTATLMPGSAVYDLRLTSGGGSVSFLLKGSILIEQMVTR